MDDKTNSLLKQYELSTQSSSNTSSSNLLENVWHSNFLFWHKKSSRHYESTMNKCLKTANTSQIKTWKTSLSTINPIVLLEKSLPICSKCGTQEHYGLDQFQKTASNNECKCNQSIANSNVSISSGISHETKRRKFFERAIHAKCVEEDRPSNRRHPLRSNFDRPRVNENISSLVPSKNVTEVNWTKEDEAEKAHKSNVAKIVFKTAKEQLMASNPAARRTLATSKKAQAKFVSPMIGLNIVEHEILEPVITDKRLKNIDPKMIELIENEIIDKGAPIGWDDIAGLQLAKSVIQEAVVWPLLRPDIFTGLRRPPKGILLFGPPGTGKTLIGKCVASQCCATFFNISASSLTSKWIGDGEKMVRALFAVASCHQPAVIFIDEIDSLLTQRSDTEHEATRRIKTEFLVQFDGAATDEEDRLLLVGATNRPQELDDAARRRLVKRLYIPLPDQQARGQIVSNLLQSETNSLTTEDMCEVARRTDGYSGADIKSLCSEAAMGPIRALSPSKIATVESSEVRPVVLQDFMNALVRVKPTVSQENLEQYVKWNNMYGQGC